LATQPVTSASSSAASVSRTAHTTIYAEQTEKFSLKSMKNDDIHNFAEKLRAKAVQTSRDATEAQLKAMTTEKDRAIITQAFRRFKFPDGKGIENAENWLTWGSNEALCDVLKLVFPKSEGQSDSQKLLALLNSTKGFKIHHCKEATHFLGFVADIQLELHFDERQEEFDNLSSMAYSLLKDIILDQLMGQKAATCEVTKQLIADIKAKAPSTIMELLDTITDEGIRLHSFAMDCARRGIPFLPFKRNIEKDEKGNDPKRTRQEGGGGSHQQERTKCSSCGKYHLGTCDPNRGKGGGENKSSNSSSSSSNKATPGKYDKYKAKDDGKKKRKYIATHQ